MKDHRNTHLKVQEHCDCFATSDPLKEMSRIKNEENATEAALKWLALAALHGINNNANKISIFKGNDGDVKVTAEYRLAELPGPGDAVGEKIIEAVNEITHFDGEKGTTPLALGIRESSIELKIKKKRKASGEKIDIKFP